MSDFDSNPFADPQAGNPFGDPSITQARQNQQQPGIDDYNPFADKPTTQPTGYGQPQQTTVPAPQPAVMQPTVEPPPAYSQTAAQQATADLQRKQEELERKAAELQRKEQELERNLQYGVKENNFPPLPSWFPIKPCFYQDFSVDIPLEFQKIVKIVYYTWLALVLLLVLNLAGTLAAFCVSDKYALGFVFGLLFLCVKTPLSFVCWYRPLYKAFSPSTDDFAKDLTLLILMPLLIMVVVNMNNTASRPLGHAKEGTGYLGYILLLFINMVGALAALCVDTKYGATFGVSIGYLVIFTPCSFVCWYRPLYKAFRSDSSFNFFLFFFIFFFQFCVAILFAIGIRDWGTCGFFTTLGVFSSGGPSGVIVGIILLCVTLGWVTFAVVIFIILVKVHRIYRNTGASFQKAQEEFASGVMSNKTVQQTAVNVGSAAAQSAAQNAFSGNQASGNRF